MSVDDVIRTELEHHVRPVDDPDAVMATVARRRDGLRRQRVLMRVAAAAAAVVVAVGIGVALGDRADDDARDVIADDPNAFQRSTVPAPPPGEVRAEQLGDGTPVWVVHHEDGTASVLDAVSTHGLPIGELVGWCPTSGSFQEPAHGAMWDEHGRYQAGPASAGLRRYPTSGIDGGQVTVTGPPRSQPRASDGGAEAAELTGTPCVTEQERRRLGDDERPLLRLHAIVDSAITLEEAMERPRGQVVAVTGSTILRQPGGGAVVCWGRPHRRASEPPTCDGVDAPQLSQAAGPDSETWFTQSGPFVGRVGDGALHDIAFIGIPRSRAGDVPAS